MERHKCATLFLIVPALCTVCTLAEDVTLSVNLRRPVSVVDEKFLSLTLDPITLLHAGDALSTNFEKSTSMARALAPAYVRLGGPVSNFDNTESTRYDLDDERKQHFIFSESHWLLMQRWTERTDLDVIACVSPKFVESSRNRVAADTPEIIELSDRLAFNASWQLGYECQTRCENTAGDLGRRVLGLREHLDGVPRYSGSIITGPDIVAYKTKQQQQYLQDYLNVAVPALSAITWHPNFAGVTLDNEGVSLHHDNLAAEKEDLYKVIGPYAARRPLWLAESKAEECKNQFLGALLWARRLGNAAKLKVDVIMRQPADLSRPTPDYWVSVLHKKLVGREVFEVKIPSGNKSHVFLYSQCTKPSADYEKGSLTIFGVNLTPRTLEFHFKGVKITTLHKYILLPGFDAPNRMFAESTLLNNEPLNLINDTDVPDIRPAISTNSSGLEISLASGAIGFWVLPDVKVKSCLEYRETANERVSLKKFEKKMSHGPFAEDERDDEEYEDSILAQSPNRNSLARSGKRRQKGSQNYSRNNGRFTARDMLRELLKMKKYLKKKLEKPGENQPLSIRGSSGLTYDRQVEESEEDEREKLLKSEDRIRSKLTEYKDYLSGTEDSGTMENRARVKLDGIHDDILPKALTLITQIENSLGDADKETAESSDVLEKLEGHMKQLYELLVRANSEESNDFVESMELEQPRKISRRDLDRRVTEEPLVLRRESLIKKRTRTDDSASNRRNERKTKRRDDIRKDLQPKVFDPRPTDSGENNFYGFFKREPEKDFPKGDVFLTTGDSSQEEDYDYVKDEDQDEGEARVNHRPRIPVDSDDVWIEDDGHSYTPNEFYENIKMPSLAVQENVEGSAELWEAENHRHQEDGDAEIEVDEHGEQGNLRQVPGTFVGSKSPRISLGINRENSPVRPSLVARQASVLRGDGRQTQHQKRPRGNDERSAKTSVITDGEESFDHSVPRLPKAASFLTKSDDDAFKRRRLKREREDLHGLLNQEMIDADADNFKDCQCRVIRDSTLPKRLRRDTDEASIEGPAEDASSEAVPEQDKQAVEVESTDEGSEEESTEETPKNAKSDETREVIESSSSSDTYTESPRDSGSAESNENNNNSAKEEPETPLEGATGNDSSEESSTRNSSAEDSSELQRNARLSESSTSSALASVSTEEVPKSSSESPENIQFFRDGGSAAEESAGAADPAEDTPGPAADVQEDPAPASEAEETTSSSAEVANEAVPEVLRETSAGNAKRETAGHVSLMDGEKVETLAEFKDEEQGKRLVSRTSGRTKSGAEEGGKTRERKLTSRVRALLALRKEIGDRRSGRIMEVPTKSGYGGRRTEEGRRKRAEQIEKLMEKLREKRKLMMRKYQDEVMDIVGEINDETKRDVKKREVWERIKDSDDFRDMIDREKLAYILMYKPVDHDFVKRDDRQNEESLNKRNAPQVEIARPLNIRERMVSPRSHRNYADPRIMRYSSPYALTEKVIQLQDLRDNDDVTSREKYNDDLRRNKQTYYALVEDLKNPRIFSYDEDSRAARRSVEVLVPTYVSKGARPCDRAQYRRYMDNDQRKDYVDESDESGSEELPAARKLYVLDPSRYKGGEPILEEHEVSSRSRDRLHKPRPTSQQNYDRKSYDPLRRADDRSLTRVPKRPDNRQSRNNIENSAVDKGQGRVRNNSHAVEAGRNAKVAERISGPDKSIGEAGEPAETRATADVAERTKSSGDRSVRKPTRLGETVDSNVRKNVSHEEKPGKDESVEVEKRDVDEDDSGSFYVEGNSYGGSEETNENESSEGMLELGKRDLLMLLPLKNRKFDRLRREVEAGNKVNDHVNLEKVSSSELRELDEPSTLSYEELVTSNTIENAASTTAQNESSEKYLIRKNLRKKYSKQRKVDALKKDLESDEDTINGLPSLIEGTIPKLQDVIVGGFEKARNLTGSVEQLIENIDERFNGTLASEKQTIASKNDQPNGTGQAFHSTIVQIKKFFSLLGGITRILRG